MCNNTKAISFWNFLKENTIEIPIIQRDYAQGRLGKENLRKNFLADLKNALDSNETMKLDFVYGSTESNKLNPLDGQQRLTTLWLLHWYIALRAGELSEDNCKIFRKFTYETRISSREFCQNLCIPEYFKNFDGNDIVGFITKQTWFYSAWKQDPTIQSMLRMLGGTKIADKKGEDIKDGIEELFQETYVDDFKYYWEKLTQKEVIVFYHLPLKDFGLSDDLYIKMNARGKQLTNFENFKADLIGYITKQAEDNPESEWKGLLDAEKGIPIKLDTDWTDIFWKNKSKESKIDEIYFAFINRFFLQELICAKKENYSDYVFSSKEIEEKNPSFKYLYGEESNDSQLQYLGLEKYLYQDKKAIPVSFFQNLCNTLNRFYRTLNILKKNKSGDLHYFPIWVDSKFEFIPKYDEREIITTLGQKERVFFLAVCRYFEKGAFDSISFKRWMRVVWNIVENSGIETIPAMIGAMRLIDELSEGAHDIYKFISKKKVKSNFAEDQVTEEIAKAKQILDENGTLRKYVGSCKKTDGSNYITWEEIIIEAEKYAFFKGAIRFLFTDGEGNIIRCDFDTKWENAQKYFDKEGVAIGYQESAKLLRALLSRIDISERWFGNYKEFWRETLLNSQHLSVVHELLMGATDVKNGCADWIGDEKMLQILLKEFKNWHILHDWRGYSVLTRYSRREQNPRSSKEIVVLNYLRNNFLSSSNDIEVHKENKIGDTKYLYGWDIPFTYKYDKKEYYFQWHRDGYVRIIKDLETCEPIVKDKSKDTPEDMWYCFSPTQEMASDTSEFTKALDELIHQMPKS